MKKEDKSFAIEMMEKQLLEIKNAPSERQARENLHQLYGMIRFAMIFYVITTKQADKYIDRGQEAWEQHY